MFFIFSRYFCNLEYGKLAEGESAVEISYDGLVMDGGIVCTNVIYFVNCTKSDIRLGAV